MIPSILSSLMPLEAVFLVVIPNLFMAEASVPSNTNTNVLILTTIVGFLTMVVQQGFSSYNARRLHSDEMIERDRKAEELATQYKAENEKLLRQTELRAQEVRFLVEQRQLELVKEQANHVQQMKTLMVINREATEAVGKQMHEESTAILENAHKRDVSTNAKLNQIHILVNSQMTAAIEAELGACRLNLALLEDAAGIIKLAGDEPNPEATALISNTKLKIADLELQLKAREASTRKAMAQFDLDMGIQ